MSDNSLLTAKWAQAVLDREWEELETRVHAFLDSHPGIQISDLVLRYNWRDGYKVDIVTAEERWLNWFSENDG